MKRGDDIGGGVSLIKGGLGEIVKKEKVWEEGRMNMKVGIENRENVCELGSNVINFEKEEVYRWSVYVWG